MWTRQSPQLSRKPPSLAERVKGKNFGPKLPQLENPWGVYTKEMFDRYPPPPDMRLDPSAYAFLMDTCVGKPIGEGWYTQAELAKVGCSSNEQYAVYALYDEW